MSKAIAANSSGGQVEGLGDTIGTIRAVFGRSVSDGLTRGPSQRVDGLHQGGATSTRTGVRLSVSDPSPSGPSQAQ
jgi:hypothetical protein